MFPGRQAARVHRDQSCRIKPKPDAATEFYDSSPDGKHFIITVDTGRANLRGVRKAYYLYNAESRTAREITGTS